MIIEVDEYKKDIPGYNPDKSEDFHSESGKLADKDFINCLKSQKHSSIVFMAGGTASGKTEFVRSYLIDDKYLVYDGTLKSFDGLKTKLDKIKRYSKNNPVLKIVFIIPQDIQQSLEIFRARDRKMREEIFFDTHMNSTITVAKILFNTDLKVEIYSSKLDREIKKLNYNRLTTTPRKKVAEHLMTYAGMVGIMGDIHL